MSRVVPGSGDTIAAGRWTKLFIKVLFPTFGLPKIVTWTPDRSLSPALASFNDLKKTMVVNVFYHHMLIFDYLCISDIKPETRLRTTSGTPSSMSSDSAKSIKASMSATALIKLDLQKSNCLCRSPSSWRRACRRCISVSAWIKSARPSTWVRSNFPLAKARLVNSPASAGLNPWMLPKAERTLLTTA